jgi:hypothetical protein
MSVEEARARAGHPMYSATLSRAEGRDRPRSAAVTLLHEMPADPVRAAVTRPRHGRMKWGRPSAPPPPRAVSSSLLVVVRGERMIAIVWATYVNLYTMQEQRIRYSHPI